MGLTNSMSVYQYLLHQTLQTKYFLPKPYTCISLARIYMDLRDALFLIIPGGHHWERKRYEQTNFWTIGWGPHNWSRAYADYLQCNPGVLYALKQFTMITRCLLAGQIHTNYLPIWVISTDKPADHSASFIFSSCIFCSSIFFPFLENII